jgi:hypothetical protein
MQFSVFSCYFPFPFKMFLNALNPRSFYVSYAFENLVLAVFSEYADASCNAG